MNCFEWQNRASDYLDGILIGSKKQEADEHLDSCSECSERYKHFRLLLSSLSSQPRVSLPISIRKSPFAAILPRLDQNPLNRTRWERLPWWVRTLTEATGIVLIILLTISVGPRLRALYERRMEGNLNELSQSFATHEADHETDSTIPLSRGKTAEGEQAADEFGSEGDGGETEAVEDTDSAANGALSEGDPDIQVGKSEVWRFIVKTDSPRDFRKKVVGILTGLKLDPQTPGLGGIEAPGGIQFDLLIPRNAVPGLMKQLKAAAPPTPAELANSPSGEIFTWYKNKSKRQIPENRTRVVIWLSQM